MNKMDIYVNNKKISYQPLFPLTWGNFFKKLLQDDDFIPRDHGIVRFLIDEADSLEIMVEHQDRLVPNTIGKVELFTKDSLSITRDGFAKVTTLINSIKAEIVSAADLYREGHVQDASSKVVKIMEAIKPMVNFVNSVGMSFNLNFDEILFNFTTNTSLRAKVESFLTTLGDVVSAQEKRDYVEMADFLEYQLIEDMNDWNRVIAILLQEVEAHSSKSN
jgi:hypothetical protein